MKLIYGEGKIQTQQGTTYEGLRCLCLTERPYAMPINATPATWERVVEEADIHVILAFKNIASARVLQDELNDLIAKWSKEEGGICEVPAMKLSNPKEVQP